MVSCDAGNGATVSKMAGKLLPFYINPHLKLKPES